MANWIAFTTLQSFLRSIQLLTRPSLRSPVPSLQNYYFLPALEPTFI
jgi:hypothetical protein